MCTRFLFFNDTATTEIYTLSLHDALPISCGDPCAAWLSAELRPGGVRRVRTRIEAGEVPVERGLGRPVARIVGNDEGSVDRHDTLLTGERREGPDDLVVGADGRHVQQAAPAVEDGHAGGSPLAPRQVDADEVHDPSPCRASCGDARPDHLWRSKKSTI